MNDNIIEVKVEAKDLNLRKSLEGMICSVDGFVVRGTDAPAQADLLIVELGDDIETDFGMIHTLQDLGGFGEIFLMSNNSDSDVVLKALRLGAKEFFSLPIKQEEFTQALTKLKERKEKTKSQKLTKTGQIVEVIGSKGGVGVTTVAVNVAVGLAETKSAQSVALIDSNVALGEIPLFLEVKPQYHLGEIVKNATRLDSTFLMNILSKHSSGVYVLPSPAYLNGYPKMTPEVMEHLVRLMQRMFDFVVIDTGQSLDDVSLRVLEMSDTVFLVSNLSLPCLSNTRGLLKTFQNLGYPARERVKIVVNRYLKNADVSLNDASTGIDKEIFWTIPNDYPTALSAINQGKPLSQVASKSPITQSLRQLAATLSAEEQAETVDMRRPIRDRERRSGKDRRSRYVEKKYVEEKKGWWPFKRS
jgi:pilus assembly protein CpaE